jgi:hypothetical protein
MEVMQAQPTDLTIVGGSKLEEQVAKNLSGHVFSVIKLSR